MIPEFFIINDMDRPYPRHVVQKIGLNLYKYIHPDLSNHPEMERESGTSSLKDFGFEWTIKNGVATFVKTKGTIVQYSDGTQRNWQGEFKFHLPIINPKKETKQ